MSTQYVRNRRISYSAEIMPQAKKLLELITQQHSDPVSSLFAYGLGLVLKPNPSKPKFPS